MREGDEVCHVHHLYAGTVIARFNTGRPKVKVQLLDGSFTTDFESSFKIVRTVQEKIEDYQ